MKRIWITSIVMLFALPQIGLPDARAQSAKTLVDQAAGAMGGMAALRAIKNQVIESEGKQFDSSSTPPPLVRLAKSARYATR